MRETLGVIRDDWKVNAGCHKARLIILLFRISHLCYLHRKRKSPLWVASFLFRAFYQLFVGWLLGIELQDGTTAGPGLRIFHGQALVVNENTILGRACTLRHSTTIGCITMPDGTQGPCPTIGNEVEIGAHVVILGGITIHNGAKIGAGSVIVHDVPENAVVVGNPARIIKYIHHDWAIENAKICEHASPAGKE